MMTEEEKFEIEGGLKPMIFKQSNTKHKASPAEEMLEKAHHVWLVAKEHILYHRTASIAAASVLAVILVLMISSGSGARGNQDYEPKVDHDFSNLKDIYELKKTEIDHWCLGGGDDCSCQDPTDPLPSDAFEGWVRAHKLNKELVEAAATRKLDVVFVGDDTTEEWNGRWMGERMLPDATSLVSNGVTDDLTKIQRLWNRTFTKAGGGEFDGLALGIYGDMIGNLLWRLQHGELPSTLNPKVWWILIGGNDLVRGQCSEEAVILGILRVAEEISMQRKDAKIVIQGILPRAASPDGSLTAHRHSGFFHVQGPAWWPSIELINDQLQQFCQKHKNFYYFDASSMLLGQISNEHFTATSQQIVTPLMPDYVHLSFLGHKVVSKQIVKKLNNLLDREDGSANRSTTTKSKGSPN